MISFDSVFKRVCVCAVDVATLKSVRGPEDETCDGCGAAEGVGSVFCPVLERAHARTHTCRQRG